jgi:hypothetical protein
MISIEEFREKLPKDQPLTEEQIFKLKDQMEQLAGVFFGMWLEDRRAKIKKD